MLKVGWCFCVGGRGFRTGSHGAKAGPDPSVVSPDHRQPPHPVSMCICSLKGFAEHTESQVELWLVIPAHFGLPLLGLSSLRAPPPPCPSAAPSTLLSRCVPLPSPSPFLTALSSPLMAPFFGGVGVIVCTHIRSHINTHTQKLDARIHIEFEVLVFLSLNC